MPRSTQLDQERIATLTPENQAGVRVVRRHHLLVRCSHWLNVPILMGLVLSGISIYWASPVYKHKPNPQTGSFDPLADMGIWICAHVPGLHQYSSPPDWVYNHISLGPGMLAVALRLHWLCAYLFMLNGLVFAAGSVMGGGWRSLLPSRTDLRDALKMFRYYLERDLLLFGKGAIATAAVGGSLLPQPTLERLGIIHGNKNWPKKDWLLNRALRIDDHVAEALYSRNRLVPTYTKSQITPLKNNYNGATLDPSYIPEWRLTLEGLASGLSVSLNIRNLLASFRLA